MWFKYVLCQETRLNSWRSIWAEHHGISPKIRWQMVTDNSTSVRQPLIGCPQGNLKAKVSCPHCECPLHVVCAATLCSKSTNTKKFPLAAEGFEESFFFVSNGHQMTTIEGLETSSDHQSYWSIFPHPHLSLNEFMASLPTIWRLGPW